MMTQKNKEIFQSINNTALEIIDENNERIRKLELVILALSETDDDSKGGLSNQDFAKLAVTVYQIKYKLNKGKNNEKE